MRFAPWPLLALLATGTVPCQSASPVTLKLATWNLEWLLTPATFNALRRDCTRGDLAHRHSPRSIPCNVAAHLERSATDIAGLAHYAHMLAADVVALEEVDGAEAARQLFPNHDFCFTGAAAVQNTGFAIRRGVPFRCGPDVATLALGGAVRRGATVLLYPGTTREVQLLAVHLKSGCAQRPLNSNVRACEQLARQAPALRDWLRRAALDRRRFVVLGDFNRDLLAETRRDAEATTGDGLWEQLDTAVAPAAVINTARDEPFRNCYPGQTYTGYIDYILLGRTLGGNLVRGSFERLTYSAADAWRLKLSDHCPVAIRLRLD